VLKALQVVVKAGTQSVLLAAVGVVANKLTEGIDSKPAAVHNMCWWRCETLLYSPRQMVVDVGLNHTGLLLSLTVMVAISDDVNLPACFLVLCWLMCRL